MNCGPPGFSPESFPEQGNILGQIAFLDEGVRPHPLHQVVFFDYVTAMLNQREENVENFGGQGDGFPVAQQHTLDRVQAKAAKLIEMTLLLAHKWL